MPVQNEEAKPVPDPTVLTTQALERGLKAERDYSEGQFDVLRERLNGIDRATEVLSETVNRVPTDVDKEISHLRELQEEALNSLAVQQELRDVATKEREALKESHRIELKVDGEKALTAALAAAEKSRADQTAASQLAQTKTETTFADALKQNTETTNVAIQSLTTSVNDLKLSIQDVRAEKRGGTEQREEYRGDRQENKQSVGLIIAMSSLAVAAGLGALGFVIDLVTR